MILGKRLRSAVASVCAALIFLSALPSCSSVESPRKLDISGTRIVVWDALQPASPGTPDYSKEVTRVIEAFRRETGVEVELRYVERREILAALSGAAPSPGPHLMFSGEWPAVADAVADLGGLVDDSLYIDAASTYWMRGEHLAGIPAFVQWTGMAVRGTDNADSGAEVRTGYWTDSPAFLRAALDCPGEPLGEGEIARFAEWVKSTYGAFSEDPLMSWQYGELDALYPVTPALFRWLQASGSGGSRVILRPPGSPRGNEHYYYTVPGYLVMNGSPEEEAAAAELGKRLAANLGRWAARTLGCVPALVSDMSIFNLESGFEYEERQLILDSLNDGGRTVPKAEDFLQFNSIAGALAEPLARFLRGDTTLQSLEESIRGAFSRHTKP